MEPVPERIPEGEPETESDRKCREVWDRINKRDPRTDPIPGDILQAVAGMPITVTGLTTDPGSGTTTVQYTSPDLGKGTVWLGMWTQWAKETGTVLIHYGVDWDEIVRNQTNKNKIYLIDNSCMG